MTVRNTKFYIITLDGRKIIRLLGKDELHLDFSHITNESGKVTRRSEYRAFVKSKELRDDNAMYYQLRRVIGISDNDCDENSLENYIIFIDFGDVNLEGKNTSDIAEAKSIIENGLYINFDSGEKHFVAFDKSASMSRQGRISFIDESIKALADERISLGIPFDKFIIDKDKGDGTSEKVIDSSKVSLSKYYTYRGLMFSNGYRIASDLLELNENTVLVLKDLASGIDMKAKIITAKEISDSDERISDSEWKTVPPEDNDLKGEKINFFDGEGIICPDYAVKISTFLGYEDNHLSTFQVRMPFTKGVLHKVNFHKFIRDEILNSPEFEVKHKLDEIYVTDVFGIERNLKDVKIILTESMFKCVKWLQYAQNNCGTEFADPMVFYFKKLSEYDHALYIGNTNAIINHSGKVALNYQFFNTLKLSDDDFSCILENYLNDIRKVSAEDEEEDAESDNFVIDEDKVAPVHKAAWREALKIDPELAGEAHIKEKIRSQKRGMLDRIYRGKTDVAGELRFLSGDLLAFLNYLAQNCHLITDEDGEFIKTTTNITENIKKCYIYPDRFYLPSNGFVKDKEVINPVTGKCYIDKKKRYFGVLRNPHLSRYEQCALAAFNPGVGELTHKYFHHLDGVVMISKNGFAAAALGGADFDGDLVKIIFDERVNQAILDGCYTADRESGEEKYKRVAPYIQIPSDKMKETIHPDDMARIPFRTVQNTFSNQIGLISNAAVKIGAKEYFGTEEEQNHFRHGCAECTIATGMEIDAAKTGVHPASYIKGLMKKAKDAAEKDNGSAEYLNFNKKVKELPYGLSKQGKSAGKDGQTCFYGNGIKIKKDYGSSAGPLTRLLTGYLSAAETDAIKSTGVKTRKRILSENISSDIENKEEIKTIVKAYLEINKYIEAFYKNRWKKTEDFDGHIITLANLHYGDLDNRFGNSEKTVADVLDDTYSIFWDLICENNGGEEILKRFNESNPKWHFTPKEDRIALLCKIIGKEITDENVMHLLTDFSCRGYFHLPYYIRDTISEYKSISDSDLKESKKDFELGKNEYTQKLYSIFETGFNDKKPRKDIESELISACRRYFREKAVSYYDRQTKRFSPSLMKAVEEFDSKHDAFWEIFNSKEIKYALSGDEESREVDQYVK